MWCYIGVLEVIMYREERREEREGRMTAQYLCLPFILSIKLHQGKDQTSARIFLSTAMYIYTAELVLSFISNSCNSIVVTGIFPSVD